MKITRMAIPEVLLLQPNKFADDRGFLSETFRADALAELGVNFTWRQENHSYSRRAGTVRAFHFQASPGGQDKLVRVVRGAILDIALDLRAGSPTYGKHVAAELSADNWSQLYVPAGFGHGICTLTDDTEITYKTTAYFAPSLEGGVLWNDPALGIDWPVSIADAILSERDRGWPTLAEFNSPFRWFKPAS